MDKIKDYIWSWPDGLVWKSTRGVTVSSRRKKFDLFMSLLAPGPEETILDIGVAPYAFRGTNFLEQWYPYPERITALSNNRPELYKEFERVFSGVKLEFGDANNLQFPDQSFNIIFSNAVVEHVGDREEQRRFVYELCRVGRRIFMTTPDYYFPVDFHTLIPFAHWFPQRVKAGIYRMLGRADWADSDRLNLLTPRELLSLFPPDRAVQLYQQRVMGMTCTLIAVAEET